MSTLGAIAQQIHRSGNLRAAGQALEGASVFALLPWSRIARSLQLTPRELQIVQRLFESRTENEIAADLGIAARTVHTHLERIHRKLDIRSRAQLLTRVMAEYLLHFPRPNGMEPVCSQESEPRYLCPLHDNRLCPLHAAQAADNVPSMPPKPAINHAR